MVKRDVSGKKKPKRAPLPRRHFVRAGELVDEPEWGDDEVAGDDLRLVRALSYYNYCDVKDRHETFRKWTLEYMAFSSFSPEEVEAVEKMEDWRIYNTIASVSRMISRGCKLEERSRLGHDARIREAIASYSRARAVREERKPTGVGGLRVDRTRDQAWHITSLIDDMIENEEEFSAYEILTREQATSAHAKLVADCYRPQAEELERVKTGPRDLREGYSHLSRTELNRLVKTTRSIVDDAERYASNRRASTPRKPRKKKERAAADVVKRVQYLQSYPDLQIVSVDPSSIVGARSVWLYNVKYKTLRKIVGESLTVSGSTIKGYDEDKSEQRSLRKPAPVIKLVLDSPTPALQRVMSGLTTKASVPNGRINSDTVILRVVK